jgi:hypothetical protein
MGRGFASRLGVVGAILVLALAPATSRAQGYLESRAQDLLGRLKWPSDPPTLSDVARMMDCIQDRILDEGTVVVKHPDVWSQARMTYFRKEFENTMGKELGNFKDYLSARIARSDTASFSSQTALGASISPATAAATAPLTTPAQVSAEREAAVGFLNNTSTTTNQSPGLPGNATFPAPVSNFSLLNATTPVGTAPNSSGTLTANTTLPLGLEPNTHIDEESDYIKHLHQIRRVNLGDDNADSAGYGLYLLRVPVSIQPGDHTKKGFGAIVNLTVRHDFNPKFLQATYRNLVIYDLADILSPFVYELIRGGDAQNYQQALQTYWKSKSQNIAAKATMDKIESGLRSTTNFSPVSRLGQRTYAIAPSDVKRVFVAQNLLNLAFAAQQALDLGNSEKPATWKVRSTDVRNFLRHELEAAYDLMEGRCRDQPPLLQDVEYVENLTDQVYCRKFEGPKGVRVDSDLEFNEFYHLYESFAHRLPGNLRFRPIGVLCWGIAIQAGLLNRQLREDMKQTKGADGYTCPAEVDSIYFYPPEPGPQAETTFQEYIKARWPMMTFALEPVVDQQNIDDAYSRQRDLQLALAFALSSGRLSFRQALNYNRQLQYEAEAILLNQTVTSFAHGNDTFGWRFTPRYQTPPDESNIHAIANLLINGGPGRNYQIDNSKLEPGMRELTAVVVMPSFVRGMRLDVAGDWFRLHDPDERTIHTSRTIELGRRINEARDALEAACKCGKYRPEDVERLRARLHQLEVMLPLQTQFVKVPYQNTLGGIALFTQGETALAPELSGFEGIETIDPTPSTTTIYDILVYGRHFSIYGSSVVVGGVSLTRDITGGNTTQTATPTGPGSFDILSREVMRVRIQTPLQIATREDGQQVVELYVATPNGISNRLQIPAKSAAPSPAPAPAPTFPVAAAPGYTIIDSTLTITTVGTITGTGTVQYSSTPNPTSTDTRIRIQSNDPSRPLPTAINLFAVFPFGDYSLPVTLKNVPLVDDTYVLDSTMLDSLAQQIYNPIFKNGLKMPTTALVSRSILIQPVAPAGMVPTTWSTTNTLSVTIYVSLNAPPTANPQPKASADRPPTDSNNALAKIGPPRSVTPTGRAKDPLSQRVSLDPARPADLPLLPPEELVGFRLPLFQTQSPGPAGATGPLASTVPQGITAPSGLTVPGLTVTATIPTTPAPGAVPIPAPSQSSQAVVVVPQRGPTVNVSVPVTNIPKAKPRGGLFHRRQATTMAPASPAASARGPLLERLMGRP